MTARNSKTTDIMELEYTDGCTCTSLTVDEVETIDMPIDELRNVILKLLTDIVNDEEILTQVIIDYADKGVSAKCDDEEVVIFNNTLKIGQEDYRIKHTYIRYSEYVHVNSDTIEKLPLNKIKELAYNAALHENDVANLQWVFTHTLSKYGDYKYIGHCECCGDNILEYKMTIQ